MHQQTAHYPRSDRLYPYRPQILAHEKRLLAGVGSQFGGGWPGTSSWPNDYESFYRMYHR
jgi:hypothetical protein